MGEINYLDTNRRNIGENITEKLTLPLKLEYECPPCPTYFDK